MRLRAIVSAAACSLMLLLTCPGSADAVDGDFHYKYVDANGTQPQKLSNPDSHVCINIEEATEAHPAHSPVNNTEEQADVFGDRDCLGTEYVLARQTGSGGEDMEFRSVYFE